MSSKHNFQESASELHNGAPTEMSETAKLLAMTKEVGEMSVEESISPDDPLKLFTKEKVNEPETMNSDSSSQLMELDVEKGEERRYRKKRPSLPTPIQTRFEKQPKWEEPKFEQKDNWPTHRSRLRKALQRHPNLTSVQQTRFFFDSLSKECCHRKLMMLT
jgi:hypothetical protein